MEVNLTQALLAGAVALAAPSLSYYLTKRHEVSVAQHNLKLEQYQEFMAALAGIIEGEATDESHQRFARSTNTLQLVASNKVLVALNAYREQISYSNKNRNFTKEDELLSMLVWEIRNDLHDAPTDSPSEFSARLWSSGPPKAK